MIVWAVAVPVALQGEVLWAVHPADALEVRLEDEEVEPEEVEPGNVEGEQRKGEGKEAGRAQQRSMESVQPPSHLQVSGLVAGRCPTHLLAFPPALVMLRGPALVRGPAAVARKPALAHSLVVHRPGVVHKLAAVHRLAVPRPTREVAEAPVRQGVLGMASSSPKGERGGSRAGAHLRRGFLSSSSTTKSRWTPRPSRIWTPLGRSGPETTSWIHRAL